MLTTRRTMRGAALLALSLAVLPGAVLPTAAEAATAKAPEMTEQQAADQRIQSLQDALQITAAQMPEWSVFMQAMRDNASATDALFRDRAAKAATMNAADNLKSYAVVARAYADDTQKLSDAFQALYGTLSDAQKQTADTLFRQQAEGQKAAQATTRK